MALEIGTIRIDEIGFGSRTMVEDHVLSLAREELRAFLLARDARLREIFIDLARPGESCRILCVKDVIQPWCKVEGGEIGSGRNHVLKNVAVVTCGQIVGFQEGIIDMSGPGARYSPFAGTLNVVLNLAVAPDLEPHQHEEAARQAGFAAAEFIGRAGQGAPVDELQTFASLETRPVSQKLPRIVYLYMLLSQGLLHDTYVLGRNAQEGLPRIISLPELLDNAIVSGNCVSACDKNTTYHHQTNPILRELWRRHGRELDFAGVVLSNEPIRLGDKENSASRAIALVKGLHPDGVILSKEGFGNPDADQMMLIRGLEQAGIKTCAITDEYPGPDGLSQSLADVTPEADAMISTGNANQRVQLPPMARILGPFEDLTKLAGAYPQSLGDDGSLEIELQGIIGATNQLGAQKLRCKEV